MFLLHETTRKLICRWAFVALCVVPTCSTVASALYSHRPWRCADLQRQLSQRYHLQASVGATCSVRPGVSRLSDLRLSDLRTAERLASLGELQVQRTGAKLLLTADQIELEAGQLGTMTRALETLLAEQAVPEIEFRADRLTINPAPQTGGNQRGPLRLAKLSVRSASPPEGNRRFWIQFEKTGEGEPSEIHLVIDELAQTNPPQLRLSIDTQQAALPVWLLTEIVPGAGRCGDAQWTGTAQIEQHRAYSQGELLGTLEAVPMSQLVGASETQSIKGQATLKLQKLTWRNGRVEQARGVLKVTDGSVSHSLLTAATERMFCVPGVAFPKATTSGTLQSVAFDELACSFRLSEAGITIWGTSHSGETRGCLISRDNRPLLLQPRYVELPVAQLVQLLSQPATSWLPATLEAQRMAGALPLPSAVPNKKQEVASQTTTDKEGVRR